MILCRDPLLKVLNGVIWTSSHELIIILRLYSPSGGAAKLLTSYSGYYQESVVILSTGHREECSSSHELDIRSRGV
ncbi:hypothetical protein BDV12DRAFT_175814, partial [Aspergillus spectabilis]